MRSLVQTRLMAAVVSATALMAGVSSAFATPVTLTGSYLQVGISDYGTFGSDGTTEPGILHDPTGKGNFYPGGTPNDYLTPGNPHDGFAINSAQTGFIVNDNNGSSAAFGTASPTNTSSGTTQAATWTGATFGGVGVTNSYSFLADSERINIATTITNNTGSDLTSLYFGRSEDPDPDVFEYGTYNTNNTRGDSVTSTANLVSAAGAFSGLTIGILNTSTTLKSNTSISFDCCANSDPAAVFNGLDDADYGANFPTTDNGDYGLQMAWDIGTLKAGESVTIDYAYVFGTNQGTVSVPGVPLPASFPMFAGAILALGAVSYGMKRKSAAQA